MTQAKRSFDCPRCTTRLDPGTETRTSCPVCGWHGTVEFFNPVDPLVAGPENALPDDATCAHHPAKRAVAICAGTGDYICSLCAIDVGGQTYSAAYLAEAGKQQAEQIFVRTQRRPDNAAIMYLSVSFLAPIFGAPCLEGAWPMFALVAAVGGMMLVGAAANLLQAFRLRGRDPFYRRIVAAGKLAALTFVCAVFGCAYLSLLVYFSITNRIFSW